MMWAVMDIGTNSCRLLIAEGNGIAGQVLPVCRQLITTRLGEGLGQQSRLIRPQALKRTLLALQEFSQIIKQYPVDRIILVATQAVRAAENRAELVNMVRENLGWELEVISGEREAWLSYLGATHDFSGCRPLVVDIGGGSTDFVIPQNGGEVKTLSIPLGALGLYERPLEDKDLISCLQAAGLTPLPVKTPLVGVGGTCTATAAVSLGLKEYDDRIVQGLGLSGCEIRGIYDKLRAMPPGRRLRVPGIYPGREDIIVPGIQLLLAVMTVLNKDTVTISDRDLLFGLIFEK